MLSTARRSSINILYLFLALAGAAFGAPAGSDESAISRGKQLFGENCGFCHGLDARGADQGPDLAHSLIVLSDAKGERLGEFLRVGRADKGMPVFSIFTKDEIAQLAAFLHDRVEASRSGAVEANLTSLVGNAKAGEAYFNGAGRCSTCHSPAGDLKGIGSKYDSWRLQDCFVNPRVACGQTADLDSIESPRRSIQVKVTTAAGEIISGTLVSLTDFEVALRDASGERRSFSRNNDIPKVEIHDPMQAHLDLLRKYSDKDLHDLSAYLMSLK